MDSGSSIQVAVMIGDASNIKGTAHLPSISPSPMVVHQPLLLSRHLGWRAGNELINPEIFQWCCESKRVQRKNASQAEIPHLNIANAYPSVILQEFAQNLFAKLRTNTATSDR
eukprot:246635-Amphidinium_carterae.1